MEQNNRYILFTGIFIGIISCMYFLSLLLQLPFLVTILLIMGSGYAIHRWLFNGLKNISNVQPLSLIQLLILLAVLCKISYSIFLLSKKHGEWDAWAVWNLDAKYLADPHNWKGIFMNQFSHPDYPLGVPGTLAFFLRLFPGSFSLLIPFVFSLLLSLCIPVLIYVELLHKNIIVAIATLFVISESVSYAGMASIQYADLPLAFFFLCAFVCMDHIAESKKYIVMASLFLGWCMWTKNEGCLLALVFLAGYAPVFFAKQNLKYSTIGFSIPFIVILVFKLTSKVQGDMLSEISANTLNLLFQPGRYLIVYSSLMENINKEFAYAKAGFYLYVILCIIEKKLPNRQMTILMVCFMIYFMIYVLTPKPLPWHLKTSQDRLLFQLMPALIYILANKFTTIRFSLPARE